MLLLKFKWINETEKRVYFFSFLSAILGALFVLLIQHFLQFSLIKVGSVNITEIVGQYIKQESSKNLPSEILKKEVNQFALTLDNEIQNFSKKYHVVLFLHEAVIANAHDYTGEIKNKLNMQVNHREAR